MAEASVDYTKHVDLVFEGGGVKGIGLAGAVETLERARLQAAERRRHVGGSDQRRAPGRRLLGRGAEGDHHRPRLPPVPGQGVGGQGAADRAVAEHPPRPRPLRGRRASTSGCASCWPRRASTPSATSSTRLRRRSAFRSRLQVVASDVTKRELLVLPRDAHEARDRAGRSRGRARGADEHEHPDLLRARPHENPETGETHMHRRRRDALELPRLALRLRPDEAAGLADLRDAARRAEAVGARRRADARAQRRKHAQGGRAVDRLPQVARPDDDGGPRPALRRAVDLRADDPDPDARRRHDRVRPARSDRALELYGSGREAAAKFLDSWDFEAYIAEYRSGKRHSRREGLVATMEGTAPIV